MKCGICESDDTVQMVEHGNTQCNACGAIRVVGFNWAPQQQGFIRPEPEIPADSPLAPRKGFTRLEFPEAEPNQPVVHGVQAFKGCMYFATDRGVFFSRDGKTVEPLPFPE